VGAFAAVVAIHVALIMAVLVSRTRYVESSANDSGATWIVLPTEPAPETSSSQVQRTPSVLSSSIHIELPDVAPVAVPSGDVDGAIDWAAEARRAAAAMRESPEPREFGDIPRVDTANAPRNSEPTHHAGETYRDASGNNVAWVNDRCYVVSEAPPLGAPDVLSRMQPTRTVCVDRQGAQGELFKGMSAYKKLHPR
jgi:hypothetical protein